MERTSQEVQQHLDAVVAAAVDWQAAGPKADPDPNAYPTPAQLVRLLDAAGAGAALGEAGEPGDENAPAAGAGALPAPHAHHKRRGSVDAGSGAVQGGGGDGTGGAGGAADGVSALRRHDFLPPVAVRLLLSSWTLSRAYLRCVGDAVALVSELILEPGPVGGGSGGSGSGGSGTGAPPRVDTQQHGPPLPSFLPAVTAFVAGVRERARVLGAAACGGSAQAGPASGLPAALACTALARMCAALAACPPGALCPGAGRPEDAAAGAAVATQLGALAAQAMACWGACVVRRLGLDAAAGVAAEAAASWRLGDREWAAAHAGATVAVAVPGEADPGAVETFMMPLGPSPPVAAALAALAHYMFASGVAPGPAGGAARGGSAAAAAAGAWGAAQGAAAWASVDPLGTDEWGMPLGGAGGGSGASVGSGGRWETTVSRLLQLAERRVSDGSISGVVAITHAQCLAAIVEAIRCVPHDECTVKACCSCSCCFAAVGSCWCWLLVLAAAAAGCCLLLPVAACRCLLLPVAAAAAAASVAAYARSNRVYCACPFVREMCAGRGYQRPQGPTLRPPPK
jgi:hypothetical protein